MNWSLRWDKGGSSNMGYIFNNHMIQLAVFKANKGENLLSIKRTFQVSDVL